MDADIRELVQMAHQLLTRTYQASARDRGRLHEIEWDADGKLPSALGEAELKADFVAGIASQILAGWSITPELFEKLQTNPRLPEEAVMKYPGGPEAFPAFSAHLCAIETLRLICIQVSS